MLSHHSCTPRYFIHFANAVVNFIVSLIYFTVLSLVTNRQCFINFNRFPTADLSGHVGRFFFFSRLIIAALRALLKMATVEKVFLAFDIFLAFAHHDVIAGRSFSPQVD